MKKNVLNLFAIVASIGLLAGCGQQSGAGDDSSASTGESTSQGGTSSESSQATSYKIKIEASSGVTVVADKETAAKGETVTLTVTCAEGFSVTAILVNGSATGVTKVNDTTYTFVMGDTSAVITTKVSVTGECVITGDIAGVLAKQADGTYKGEITANTDSTINVTLAGTTYDFGDVDLNHCFGSIDSPVNAKSAITLGGNGVYEVTLDPSLTKGLTFYRKAFVHAPTTDKEILTLFGDSFSGRSPLDGQPIAVKNLVGTTYSDFTTGVRYNWNRYENNVSFATVTNVMDPEEEFYVYKGIEGDSYRVVDTYIESVKDAAGKYFDPSTKSDRTKYAASYQVVAAINEDGDPLRNYKRTSDLAELEIGLPSHNMYSLDQSIAYGYRVGFTVEDDRVATRVAISNEENGDGTTTTTIYSWKNYNPAASIYSSATEVCRYEYHIELVWNADSTIASASFLENYYNEDTWTFDDNDALNGGSAKAGTSPRKLHKASWSYEYGAVKTGKPTFNYQQYFISSIDSAVVSSKGHPDNEVQQKTVIDQRRTPGQKPVDEDSTSGYQSLLKLTYSPSTALDAWQYGIVDSSDTNVVGLDFHGGYSWAGLGVGSAKVTIGNHANNPVTAQLDLTVVNDVKVKSYNVSSLDGSSESNVPTSSSVAIDAGNVFECYLWGSPSDAATAPSVTCTDSRVSLSLSGRVQLPSSHWLHGYDYPTYKLTIDASALSGVSEDVNCKIVVDDPNADSSWPASSREIALLVKKGTGAEGFSWPTSLAGMTWIGDQTVTEEKEGADVHLPSSMVFSNEEFAVEGQPAGSYKKVAVSVTYQNVTRTLDLGYKYDAATPTFELKPASYYDAKEGAYISTGTSIDKKNGYLGVWITLGSWTAEGEDLDCFLGYPEEDAFPEAFQWFVPNAN